MPRRCGALNQAVVFFGPGPARAGTRQGLGPTDPGGGARRKIYLRSCGRSMPFTLASDHFEHFHDPENAGKRPGVSHTVAIRFFQSALHPMIM